MTMFVRLSSPALPVAMGCPLVVDITCNLTAIVSWLITSNFLEYKRIVRSAPVPRLNIARDITYNTQHNLNP